MRRLVEALSAFVLLLFLDSSSPGAKPGGSRLAVQKAREIARKSTNAFRHPEELAFGNFHVLRVVKVRSILVGAGDQGKQDVEMLTYNGRLVGPTIRVRRGTRLSIQVRNQLPGKDQPHPPGDVPHGLCTTNLHTHGLHVSPRKPADDIFLEIPPGKHHTFKYDIPDNHPSGTFWYHAHKHGSVAYQLTNGMAGALIVEGSANDNLHDLEDLPEIAAARDRVFVFQQLWYRVSPKDQVGRVDARDLYAPEPKPFAPGCDTPPVDAPLTKCTAINGVVMPTYEIAPGEVQRWRFIHAGREDKIPLMWLDKDFNPTDKIKFNEIAVDGLVTGMMTEKTLIELNPGNRSDVLINAPDADGVYYLQEGSLTAKQSLRRADKKARYLAKVWVHGVRRSMTLPKDAQLRPCKAMRSVADGELVNLGNPRVVRLDSDDASHTFNVDGKPFSRQDPLELRLNTAEEWVIKAIRNPHVFHIHVNPFELILEKNQDGTVERSEWRDTIFIDQGHQVTIRTRFRDFPGKTVLHCHILDHEDQGMMRKVWIRRANAAAPAKGADKKLSKVNRPAPALRLPDVRGTSRSLGQFKGRPVVLVFFQGMACAHCASRLRELARHVDRSADVNTALIAVSSERIGDPGAALRMLGVSGRARFHLLVDERHRAFRGFGCFDEEPLHGLFLIDQAGRIRSRYVGEAPFGDLQEVIKQLRDLSALGKEHHRKIG
jgi:FtsP/CotA-like multicopper oxidase with cupredoxin domain/peroxiredoxin